MDEKIKVLMNFGLTENEARVYITMLQIPPATGYQISKKSGISRSKIYSILSALVEKDFVLTSKDESVIYTTVPVVEVSKRLERESQTNISKFRQTLSSLEVANADGTVWSLPNYQQVFSKAVCQIEQAKKSLYVQVYSEDLSSELITALGAADRRLHEFVVILFSQHHRYDLPFRRFYKHYFEADKLQDYGGRWLNIVSDNQIATFGRLLADSANTGVITTKNPSMVFLAQEYVLHDAYCLRTLQQLHESATQEFGKDLEGVRDIYFKK
ncbi:TrmB family transcriptional regulator [Liquorilactobacillus sicerae]|uniref:TrmB family transcriptional regulator n=1 Tax=Liquorilactobacillus sicerae TaxID=1416943 RepID=UPI0024801337|nr:helix-turn-helix domain-containing protein [Liquorilactobacillus sicerae]